MIKILENTDKKFYDFLDSLMNSLEILEKEFLLQYEFVQKGQEGMRRDFLFCVPPVIHGIYEFIYNKLLVIEQNTDEYIFKNENTRNRFILLINKLGKILHIYELDTNKFNPLKLGISEAVVILNKLQQLVLNHISFIGNIQNYINNLFILNKIPNNTFNSSIVLEGINESKELDQVLYEKPIDLLFIKLIELQINEPHKWLKIAYFIEQKIFKILLDPIPDPWSYWPLLVSCSTVIINSLRIHTLSDIFRQHYNNSNMWTGAQYQLSKLSLMSNKIPSTKTINLNAHDELSINPRQKHYEIELDFRLQYNAWLYNAIIARQKEVTMNMFFSVFGRKQIELSSSVVTNNNAATTKIVFNSEEILKKVWNERVESYRSSVINKNVYDFELLYQACKIEAENLSIKSEPFTNTSIETESKRLFSVTLQLFFLQYEWLSHQPNLHQANTDINFPVYENGNNSWLDYLRVCGKRLLAYQLDGEPVFFYRYQNQPIIYKQENGFPTVFHLAVTLENKIVIQDLFESLKESTSTRCYQDETFVYIMKMIINNKQVAEIELFDVHQWLLSNDNQDDIFRYIFSMICEVFKDKIERLEEILIKNLKGCQTFIELLIQHKSYDTYEYCLHTLSKYSLALLRELFTQSTKDKDTEVALLAFMIEHASYEHVLYVAKIAFTLYQGESDQLINFLNGRIDHADRTIDVFKLIRASGKYQFVKPLLMMAEALTPANQHTFVLQRKIKNHMFEMCYIENQEQHVCDMLEFAENTLIHEPEKIKQFLEATTNVWQDNWFGAISYLGSVKAMQILIDMVKLGYSNTAALKMRELLCHKNKQGYTALHKAILQGHDDMVNFLISQLEEAFAGDPSGLIQALEAETNEKEKPGNLTEKLEIKQQLREAIKKVSPTIVNSSADVISTNKPKEPTHSLDNQNTKGPQKLYKQRYFVKLCKRGKDQEFKDAFNSLKEHYGEKSIQFIQLYRYSDDFKGHSLFTAALRYERYEIFELIASQALITFKDQLNHLKSILEYSMHDRSTNFTRFNSIKWAAVGRNVKSLNLILSLAKLAFKGNKSREFIEYLLSVDEKDTRTPLYYASKYGNFENVELLLKEAESVLPKSSSHHSNNTNVSSFSDYVDYRSDIGSTALIEACSSKNDATIKLLIDAGADPNIINKFRYSANKIYPSYFKKNNNPNSGHSEIDISVKKSLQLNYLSIILYSFRLEECQFPVAIKNEILEINKKITGDESLSFKIIYNLFLQYFLDKDIIEKSNVSPEENAKIYLSLYLQSLFCFILISTHDSFSDKKKMIFINNLLNYKIDYENVFLYKSPTSNKISILFDSKVKTTILDSVIIYGNESIFNFNKLLEFWNSNLGENSNLAFFELYLSSYYTIRYYRKIGRVHYAKELFLRISGCLDINHPGINYYIDQFIHIMVETFIFLIEKQSNENINLIKYFINQIKLNIKSDSIRNTLFKRCLTDKKSYNLLRCSIMAESLQCLEIFLDLAQDIYEYNSQEYLQLFEDFKYNQSLLAYAVYYTKNLEFVRLMIDKWSLKIERSSDGFITILYKASDKYTALYYACRDGNLDIASYLNEIAKEASGSVKSDKYEQFIIQPSMADDANNYFIACFAGKTEVIKFLHNVLREMYGSDTDLRFKQFIIKPNKDFYTCLASAISNGYYKVVRLILEQLDKTFLNDVDGYQKFLNTKTKHGKTVFDLAEKNMANEDRSLYALLTNKKIHARLGQKGNKQQKIFSSSIKKLETTKNKNTIQVNPSRPEIFPTKNQWGLLEDVPEAEPEVIPQAEPEVIPQAEPEVIPQAEPEVIPQAEPEVIPQAEPEAIPQAEPEVIPQAEPEVIPQTEPEVIPEAEPEIISGVGPKLASEAMLEANFEVASNGVQNAINNQQTVDLEIFVSAFMQHQATSNFKLLYNECEKAVLNNMGYQGKELEVTDWTLFHTAIEKNSVSDIKMLCAMLLRMNGSNAEFLEKNQSFILNVLWHAFSSSKDNLIILTLYETVEQLYENEDVGALITILTKKNPDNLNILDMICRQQTRFKEIVEKLKRIDDVPDYPLIRSIFESPQFSLASFISTNSFDSFKYMIDLILELYTHDSKKLLQLIIAEGQTERVLSNLIQLAKNQPFQNTAFKFCIEFSKLINALDVQEQEQLFKKAKFKELFQKVESQSDKLKQQKTSYNPGFFDGKENTSKTPKFKRIYIIPYCELSGSVVVLTRLPRIISFDKVYQFLTNKELEFKTWSRPTIHKIFRKAFLQEPANWPVFFEYNANSNLSNEDLIAEAVNVFFEQISSIFLMKNVEKLENLKDSIQANFKILETKNPKEKVCILLNLSGEGLENLKTFLINPDNIKQENIRLNQMNATFNEILQCKKFDEVTPILQKISRKNLSEMKSYKWVDLQNLSKELLTPDVNIEEQIKTIYNFITTIELPWDSKLKKEIYEILPKSEDKLQKRNAKIIQVIIEYYRGDAPKNTKMDTKTHELKQTNVQYLGKYFRGNDLPELLKKEFSPLLKHEDIQPQKLENKEEIFQHNGNMQTYQQPKR